MHGAAVKLPEVFDLRQFIDQSSREQKHAPRNPFPVLKDRGKSAIPPLNINDFRSSKFDRLVSTQLIAADLQKFRGTRAVSGEEPVENARWFIARMPGIAYKHTAQTSTEHERRAQPRWPPADDDRVKNFRVGRARRLGCDHNDSKKLRNRAERESTRAIRPRKQSRNRCTRGGWRRTRTFTLESALLSQAVFRLWERGPMAPITARTP